jgi:hypothetical protein
MNWYYQMFPKTILGWIGFTVILFAIVRLVWQGMTMSLNLYQFGWTILVGALLFILDDPGRVIP